MGNLSPITAGPQSTSRFNEMEDWIKAAGLPELFNTPCAEHWENEAEYNYLGSVIYSTDDNGEEWLDFNDDAWNRLESVHWTETESTRELPKPMIKFTLRYSDDYEEMESGYIARLETFTETATYVPHVGTVYVCEAKYSFEGNWTTRYRRGKR